ncbi:MAG: BrnA antitoxin family protein [Amaricoccus sp.]
MLPSEIRKRRVTIMLDPDVIEHFKAGGKGWQTRINAALRKAAGL